MGSMMCLSKGPKTDSPLPSLPPWAASQPLEPALHPGVSIAPPMARVEGKRGISAQTISKTVEGFEVAGEGARATQVKRRDPFLCSELKP